MRREKFQLLRNAGLYGKELFYVSEKTNVERYNQCLKEIGIEPTKLTEFSIDGIGYSPEIAAEHGDPQYLSHDGIVNPYAIILSPEQEDLPIYSPYYSFYRDMMKEVFKTFRRQISDITLRTAIYIDLDEGLINISQPQILLLMEGVVVRFHVIGPIVDALNRQREIYSLLIKKDEENWMDNTLIEEMRKNIEEYGDLRYQRMQLIDMPYMQVRSFYTPTFGGVYVFRDRQFDNNILICIDGEHVRKADGHVEYDFSDPNLYNKLVDHTLIDLQSEYYKKGISTKKLKRLAECMFVNALTSKDEEIDIVSLTEAKRSKYAKQLLDEGILSPVYEELLEFAHKTVMQRPVEIKRASPELQKILAHPHQRIKDNTRLVVHRLLAHLSPIDIVDLYVYAKEIFFDMYSTWPENKKVWAVELLKKHKPPVN